MPTGLQLFILHLLLSLTLLSTLPSLSPSVTATQPPDGHFGGWHEGDIVPSGDVVYVIDWPHYIRCLNATTGAVLSPYVEFGFFQGILDLAVDAGNDRVYVLVQTGNGPSNLNLWLAAFTSQLQSVGNVSLATLSPPPDWFDRPLRRELSVDTDGNLLLVRELSNGAVMVQVLSSDGKQLSSWSPTGPKRGSEYVVAVGVDDRVYFHGSVYIEPRHDLLTPLYITTKDGELNSTLYLNTSTCERTPTIAVSRTGNIAIGCDNGLLMFDSRGELMPSFDYTSILQSADFLEYLAFDARDRLLAVASMTRAGVQVISSNNGDLLSVWSNGVPGLGGTYSISYEPHSHSLLAFHPTKQLPVQRVDADKGSLLQEYRGDGRLADCGPMAMAVGSLSGDVWVLLTCYASDHVFAHSRVVLHTMTANGRLRRELTLSGWSGATVQSSLVVCEDKGLFFLLSDLSGTPNVVMSFALNGTNLFNSSDVRMGNLTHYNTQLLRVNDDELAVVDTYHRRIFLLDLDNGDYLGDIRVANDTTLLSAVYDSESSSWYRSEIVYSNHSINYTIGQYAMDGSVLTRYSVNDLQFDALSIGGSGEGRRLYGLDRYEEEVVWWNIGEQQQRSATVTDAARLVQASDARALAVEYNDSDNQRRGILHSEQRRVEVRVDVS